MKTIGKKEFSKLSAVELAKITAPTHVTSYKEQVGTFVPAGTWDYVIGLCSQVADYLGRMDRTFEDNDLAFRLTGVVQNAILVEDEEDTP